MPWSTRELADLTGTTVKTVRYYHQIGLLDEPERLSNGYKQYGVDHLVRLLRIKRLGDLGVPLAQIASMGDPDQESADSLRVIDAELAATITRLQRIRAELTLILDHESPADLPAGFGEGASELSDPDRALLLIYSRVFTTAAMDDLREMVQDSRRSPMQAEFDVLAADADEATRERLSVRFAPYFTELATRYPWLDESGPQFPRSRSDAHEVIVEAVTALYNPAQLDVLRRAILIREAARTP
jgi:DNA-binding transcriptional MerR regulator